MAKTPRERISAETVSVKNLECIEEASPQSHSGRLGAMVMASFGGACIVFSALFLVRSPTDEKSQAADPLGELVAASHPAPSKKKAALGLAPDEVSFPSVLSARKDATTAMAAVQRDKATPGEAPLDLAATFVEPPVASDRLPVVPLPAQDILGDRAAPVAHTDTLATMAKELSREPATGELAAAGAPGAYQLQVSSFKTRPEAEAFTMSLRRRGHKAHVEEAQVPMRGTWYRVKIGPFKYKRSAQIYREEFEAKERVVSFVVDPPKTSVKVDLSVAEPSE